MAGFWWIFLILNFCLMVDWYFLTYICRIVRHLVFRVTLCFPFFHFILSSVTTFKHVNILDLTIPVKMNQQYILKDACASFSCQGWTDISGKWLTPLNLIDCLSTINFELLTLKFILWQNSTEFSHFCLTFCKYLTFKLILWRVFNFYA